MCSDNALFKFALFVFPSVPLPAVLRLRRRRAAMKVGFLISDGNIHHAAHVVPVAQALAETQPGWLVFILTAARRTADEVERLLSPADRGPVHLRMLPQRGVAAQEADPLAVMRERDIIASLDAVVVTSPDVDAIGGRERRPGQKIIYQSIGAKDHECHRADWGAFDLLLVAGEKTKGRLDGLVDSRRIAIVGCPKFDFPGTRRVWPAIADDRPVVLYSPHYAPDLSSWYRWGRTVLDWFVEHDEYRLIFAPHVRLFERRFARSERRLLPHAVGRIDERYLKAPNIHIDLGSSLSTSRAYTDHADIFLGDAGGQLYEFLVDPRPCGFLNVQGPRPNPDDPSIFNWRAGVVIDDISLLPELLETTRLWHDEVYRPIQQDMFAQSISITETPASRRAARAIAATVMAG